MVSGLFQRRRWRKELAAPGTRQAALNRLRMQLRIELDPFITGEMTTVPAHARAGHWEANEAWFQRRLMVTAHRKAGVLDAADDVRAAVAELVEELLAHWRAGYVHAAGQGPDGARQTGAAAGAAEPSGQDRSPREGHRQTSGPDGQLDELAMWERNEEGRRLFGAGDRAQAIAIWRELAERGYAASMANLLIECAADGDGAQALHWYHRAVAAGLSIPAHDPGIKLRNTGRDTGAEVWWRSAAEHLRDGRSCEYLGIALRERGQVEEAEKWLLTGTRYDDAACGRELAGLAFAALERATSREQQTHDAMKAMAWANWAAQRGDVQAQKIVDALRTRRR